MLGLRGCRLGIAYPEITEMQARAVFEAAAEVQKKGIKVKPEIMIPLVGFKKELDLQVGDRASRTPRRCRPRRKQKLSYIVGTMIEVPRGALTADEIAKTAEFFSFGTNDLTQTALGMSRDDSRHVPAALSENGDHQEEPLRHDRPDRRRPTDADRGRERPQDAVRTSSSASAANTAAIPIP